MKFVVVLCDGMADEKIESLDNQTIMQKANLNNFDYMAKNGVCGFIHSTPNGMAPGSDICNLSIFGYNPQEYYTGRSPLEAASIGIELGKNDFAFRCNLITLSEENTIMDDFSGHHIDNETAKKIISFLSEKFKKDGIELYSGVGYRNLLIIRNANFNLKTTPPHDITGQKIQDYLPKGDGSEIIIEIMKKANNYLKEIDSKKVNNIWLWGEGKKPALDLFEKKYGLKGAVIAAVDLIKGIGINAGLDIIEVPGATGFIDTDFKAKAEYTVKAFEKYDYVFLHIEAPDEAGHMGSIEEKIKASENINNLVLPVLLEYYKKNNDMRILITPDHPTPISIKTHTNSPVPAIIFGKNVKPDTNLKYDEFIEPTFEMEDGYKIAELFINKININGG